jgi:DNA-binding NarL/FixJ family response regulator
MTPEPGLSVFLVEDAPVLRARLVREFIRMPAVRLVGTSARADAAIQQILALRPRVVVLDLQLADGTGWDVLDGLGDQRKGIAIVILSNHASEPFREAARARKVDYFFDKTSEFDSFLALVEKLAKRGLSDKR